MKSTYDVVVLGAGHNGLVAGAYLARDGLEVLVLEAAEEIGGMTTSAPVIPGAPHHVVNRSAADVIFMLATPVIRDLHLERHGLLLRYPDPSYVYLSPDGASLAIWRDPRRTAAEIARFSGADAAAYLEYARMLDALLDIALPYMLMHPTRPAPADLARVLRGTVKGRRHLREIAAYGLSSGEASITERFSHPVTIAALHALGSGAGPIKADGTSLTGILLAFLHRFGAGRPVGGMQAVPESIAASFRAAGGEVVTGSPVAEITVAGGRATGVRLRDGRVVLARRAVVSSCDPRTTLGQLLPDGHLPAVLRNRVGAIPANAGGAGAMKLDIALSGQLRLDRHSAWRGDDVDLRVPAILVGTPEGTGRAFAMAGAGLVPDAEDLHVWYAVPTAIDPSQAPAGQDVLYAYCPVMPWEPQEGWAVTKDRAVKALVDQTQQYFGGLAELEVDRVSESPLELGERTGASRGAVLHVDMGMLRSGGLRPALGLGGYSTPVDALYLTGAGTHPGGGVSGAPGWLCARHVHKREVRARSK